MFLLSPRFRRRLVSTRLRLGALLLLCGLASPLFAAEKPNVLFLNIDDLRDVRAYNPQVKTPNLDRLAAEGVRFDSAYVQATFCNPSRSSFLTGLRPYRTGVTDNRAHFRDTVPDVVTLPQHFRQNGYLTYRFGKIFHGAENMDDPASWDHAEYPRNTPAGRGKKHDITGGKIRWCWWAAPDCEDEALADGIIARKAVEFLEGKHEKPFFLAVGFHKPHDPFVAPKRYFDLYPPESLPLHSDPSHASPTPDPQMTGWKRIFETFTPEQERQFLRAYSAASTFADAQVGKVLGALDRNGLRENTIVFLMSDHGYHLGEREWWNKATLYEYSTRTPLIARVPGVTAAGRPCRRIVEFLDLYPTLVELAGLNAPPHLQGRSLVPLLENPDRAWERPAYSVLRRGKYGWGRSVRTENWRYIRWENAPEAEELFDHRTDPGEWRNLAKDPAHAETVARLRTLLQTLEE